MTGRLLPLATLGVVVAAVTMSSCSTFDSTDVVARAGGAELTESELRDMLESPLAEHPALLGSPPVGGEVSGDGARRVINFWVGLTAITESGLLDQAAMDGVREELAAQLGDEWEQTSPELQDLAVELNTVTLAEQEGTIESGAVDEVVRAADVFVSSRYGRWDDDLLRVEANS